MANSIGSIIQEWLRVNNLQEKMRESEVPGYWLEIVGESVARQAHIERIDKGRMFIRVESATWRNEIVLRREEIRAKVNEHFGAEVVKEVIVR